MSKIFYTSDLHLGNKNIIGYENRPWETVEEMNRGLIEKWNAKVQDNDEVYVLGDFCFKGAGTTFGHLANLKGRIHLIYGNHDHAMHQTSFKGLLSTTDRITLDGWYAHFLDEGREVVLSHFPILFWDGMDDRGSFHLYGHMHSRPDKQHPHPMAYNVGVDVNNYEPVTLDELLQKEHHADQNQIISTI